MKKLLFLTAILVGMGFQSNAQIDLDDEMMNGSTIMAIEGFTYVYEVDFYGDIYDFIVHIKSIGDDGIVFTYEMANSRATNGTVKISPEALENSIVQHNYFAGGELDLIDQTTVWVSKKVFMELVDNGSATISPDGGMTEVVIGDAMAMHNFEFDNTLSDEVFDDISYIYAQSEDGSVKYWIHMSKYNPMILKMDVGWSLTLKELREE